MDLVGQIGKTDVAHQLFADNIYAVVRCKRRARTIGHAIRSVAVAGRDVGVRHLWAQECQEVRETALKEEKLHSC